MFYIIICIFARFLPYFPLFIWHQIPIHINPLLTKFACCRAALFSGFSISHIPNIFYVFTSTTLGFCVGRDLSSLFVSFLVSFFFSIFYMQIEFSSILIGFLIGYTCVYIRTSRLAGSKPSTNSPPRPKHVCVHSIYL